MKLLFAEAMAPGQLYRASPMSLLYAIAPLHEALRAGGLCNTCLADLIVLQPQSLPDLLAVLEAHRPDLIGLSVTTYGIRFARHAARRAKAILPDVRVVVGGAHFDGLYDHYSGQPDLLDEQLDVAFDVVISGDAAQPLAWLVKLSAGELRAPLASVIEKNRSELESLPGRFAVWWRANNRLKILQSEARPRRAEPPARARLPRELLPPECEYQFSIFRDAQGCLLRTAQVMTYHGCLFAANPKNACSFCFAAHRYQRSRIQEVVAELRQLRDAGYQAVFFDDAVFTSPSRARKAELRELAGSLGELRFDAIGFQTRADFLDAEVLEILRSVESRWYCSLGLESTDPGILQLVGKKQTVEEVHAALGLLTRSEFDVGLYLLFGALGDVADGCHTLETRDTAERTIDFVALQHEQGVRVVCVLPGLSMILPGTRDAHHYESSASNIEVPLRFDICYEGDPWRRFEGGLGMHAPGVTTELVEHIDEYGRRRLGSVWNGESNG